MYDFWYNYVKPKYGEALIQIVCKNDETRVFFSQMFFVFYNKEI